MFLFLSTLILLSTSTGGETIRDIYPDTWVGVDALGRVMPDISSVGPLKTDKQRVVGIFYITWHSDNLANLKSPYSADVTKILQKDPSARFDAHHPLWTEASYHWGEPEMGYFLSRDEYVIRKDLSMLTDAGVDVLILDVTNAVLYWEEWDKLFSVMRTMKEEGNKVPYFCFWAFNGPSIAVVEQLYQEIYKKEKFKEFWFYWDGKPLLLYNGTPNIDANGVDIKHPNPYYDPAAKSDPTHPHYNDPRYTQEFLSDYSEEVKQFFTLRTMWWGYYQWAGKRAVGTEGYWSFGYDLGDERVRKMNPSELISPYHGRKEQAAVTPAQHASSLIGKSWSRAFGEPELNEYDLPVAAYVPWLNKEVEHPEGYGIYFQERWDEAIQEDPDFIYVNDWNEWTAGKYHFPEGKTVSFMRRESPFFFVDQYNAEFNRTIQPMRGGYTDNYYMQMVMNIRRYKGVRPIPELKGITRIKIDGEFDDWDTISNEYRDTIGDTFHRDYPGYGGLHYKDESGRNDIITTKVAVDEQDVYFFVETRAPISCHMDKHWMLLLLDTDQDFKTGWEGFDYIVNLRVLDENSTCIMQYELNSGGSGNWKEIDKLPYRYKDNKMELGIPRVYFSKKSNHGFQFDFKWADNPSKLESILSLCTEGDTAPNRRFRYRCIWSESRSSES